MDRNRLLPRLSRRFIAVVSLSVSLLVTGCGSATHEDYRTVTEADVETKSLSPAEQSPVEQGASVAADPGDAADSTPTDRSQQDVVVSEPTPAETASVSEQPREGNRLTASRPNALSSASDADETVPATTPIEVPLAESLPVGGPGADALVRPIKLLVPEQTFSVEGPEGALRITYDDFDIEKVLNVPIPPPDIVDHFPDWLAGLDGRRVRVRGFMYPTFQETGLGGFVLARDYGVCCFGPQGKIYHLVEVAMREGESTDYIHARPFDVVGEFHIRPDADGEELLQLYQIEDAIVIEK